MIRLRFGVRKNSGTVPGFFQEYDIIAPRQLSNSLLNNC